jgi:hypothetical protein
MFYMKGTGVKNLGNGGSMGRKAEGGENGGRKRRGEDRKGRA